MGRKHSKNAGIMGSEALTYHERKGLGHGMVQERLGKDSVGNYYDCRLTLTTAVDPVCTPKGFLFSREAILENLLEQKKGNKRKLAAFEAQQKDDARKLADKAAIEQEAALLAFDRQNHMGASEALTQKLRETISEEAEVLLNDKKTAAGAVNIETNKERMKEMRAFWLPGKAGESKVVLDKPDMSTVCPASGAKIKLKDLISVKFTPVPDGGPHDFMDPITKDVFTNASRLVVLKPTGDVVLKETWDKCIKPDGHYGGKPVGDEDVLELQRGGTGFAAHDKDLQAKKRFLLGPGSGLADRRDRMQRSAPPTRPAQHSPMSSYSSLSSCSSSGSCGSSDEQDNVCWICLAGADAGALSRPCGCPRLSHAPCLARWQLQQAGKYEQSHCRFCQQQLPDWREAHQHLEKAPPRLTVQCGGQTHYIEAREGTEGREAFMQQIRSIFGLAPDVEPHLTFACAVPGQPGNTIQLEGAACWSAALHLASISAGERLRRQAEIDAAAAAPHECEAAAAEQAVAAAAELEAAPAAGSACAHSSTGASRAVASALRRFWGK
ncbi:Nitric oxide synthase-interacting [Micractinium conductrix]|uniref:Nitric oxide synthase-interacting n=1 Tax=Micractinium conductrix TaxID=554055 RepID=A0A2P6V640_9CHLO|nr:Nitric oxide synthase-interacting [Micractinium conductrix]|eukprot:PSC69552.1 Nitric oxide synthase-interacting [Micractinium conductrix]